MHGEDRFAAVYGDIDRTMIEYDRWVDLLHARDDALIRHKKYSV